MASLVSMQTLLATPNQLSIGGPNYICGSMLAMPKSLAERLKRIRVEAGYGGERQRAEFARKVGITPPSLADLESGESHNLGKSLPGYLSIGANLNYIIHEKGPPMVFKDIEKHLRAQTLMSMLMELEEQQLEIVENVTKGLIRAKPDASGNDPFKQDPPAAPKKKK